VEYNTDHIGYKLYSGQLKGNRKNSEQLNKFLAGFFDADGSVYYSVDTKGYGRLRAKVTQSEVNDPNGKMLYALKEYYSLGTIEFNVRKNAYTWVLSAKDSISLFNRIGKHLIIKRYHYENMIKMFKDKQKVNVDLLRKQSRVLSASKTHKKHVSPSYLAGMMSGDGYIKFIVGKEKTDSRGNRYISNNLRFVIVLHADDSPLLMQIRATFGGSVNVTREGHYRWEKTLGKGTKDAHGLIKKVMRSTILDIKYSKLCKMNMFYNQLAETKRTRP